MKRWIIVTAIAASMLAACGGGDKPSDSSTRDDTGGARTESERLVSAQAVLSRAAERTQEIDTLSGEFSMKMKAGGTGLTFHGTMAFRAPDAMYMVMTVFGQEMEVLMLLPDMYVNVPDQGWKKASLEGMGVNLDQLRQYMEQRGIVDLEQTAKSIADSERLPNEDIDGVTYAHYRGTLDVSKLSEQVPDGLDGLFDQETLSQAMDAIKGATYEFWVDEETSLPRRFIMNMEMEIPEAGAMDFGMTMDFLEYNGDVDIPEPPEDAEPLELP